MRVGFLPSNEVESILTLSWTVIHDQFQLKNIVILCILSFICYIVYRPYLKGHNPKTAKHMKREQCSLLQRRELERHYPNYFNLTNKARHSLAKTLGMTHKTFREWMMRKRNKENNFQLGRIEQQPQKLHEKEHRIDPAGILYL